ncbi:cytochrome P450 [Aspergillus pseudonomiae]|uniref:Cytochrome P450 n=1 Tax=Aspergillus pseudonomiae TaxID=1506151 RepID=A0A5N6I7D0_9EURO|nr:cytochrome P450 [Aspergillus pseudonomiae]KAB8261640.1 cytochrome P450 [Aspergillus pseudonomiae]KAE8406873.1 cytochrome P450 [Aspergillus pseudonomiae]
MSPHWPLLGVFCLLGGLCVALYQHSGRSKTLPLPPQPSGGLVLGNLLEVLRASKESLQHILMQEWAREHGEVCRVRLGPEIMDRSSAISSERPRWIVSNELICNRLNVLLLHGSDPRWKVRPNFRSGLSTEAKLVDCRILQYETARFLYDIANNPEAGQDGVRILRLIARYTYSAFATQTFGMDIPNADDPVIEYIHETGLAQILGTIPGMHMVDIFTWLNYLPLCLKPWERDARKRSKRDLEWCMARLERIKDPAFAGQYMADAFLPSVIQAPDRGGFTTEEQAAYLSLQLIIGAADTSQISTWSFLEAMLQYPDVQQKARAQIEAVVGDRLPDFADLERIPYIRCIMKELWRWRPPVSLGHPHVTTKDIIYKGQQIPKGARLHLNAWAISHDPKRHEDPDRFWPERYADDHTTTMQSINSSDVTKRDHFAFGAGRRICPGYHVAERSLAIAMMRILWAFEVKWAEGTKHPVDPLTYTRRSEMPGNPSSRLPVALRVLNQKKAKIINNTFQALQQERLPIATPLTL